MTKLIRLLLGSPPISFHPEELRSVLEYQERLNRKREPNPALGEVGQRNDALLTMDYESDGPVKLNRIEMGQCPS